MNKIRAGVQYGDWEGTASADNGDNIEISKLLEKKGLLNRDNEFLLAVEVWIGENHGGEVIAPNIHCLILDVSNYDNVDVYLTSQPDPLPLKSVDVELTLNEFFGLFKRFSVVNISV